MIDAQVVGAIAHGTLEVAQITPDAARALVNNGLGYETAQLISATPDAADPTVAQILNAAAKFEFMRSMQIVSTANRVASLLSEAGVAALVYKGPALAVQTTGSWRGRGSADVDILIAPDTTTAANGALLGAGLTRRDGLTGPPSRMLKFRDCERAYVGLAATVDLHWRVEATPSSLRIPFEELWVRRESLDIEGLRVDCPSKVDALLMTAVHGTKERWARGRWVLDAVRQVEQLDPALWAQATRRARRSLCSRTLDIMLGVVDVAGGRLPDGRTPSDRARSEAERWLTLPSTAHSDKQLSVAFRRRLDQFLAASTPWSAADGWLRALDRQVSADGEKTGGHRVKLGSRGV